MSIESGNLTLRRYYIEGKCKASSNPFWIDRLKQNIFSEKKLISDEENLGWTVLGNELSTDFSLENTIYGKYILFSLRRDYLKIPSTLLQLHLKHRIHERLKEIETDTISQKQKVEIKEEVLEHLLSQTPPHLQIAQVVIDTAKSEVFITSTSDKMNESFELLFQKTFELDLFAANFMSSAQKLLDAECFEQVLDDPSMILIKDLEVHPEFEDSPEGKLGASFLTWLLYIIQQGDGTWNCKSLGEIGILMEELLVLEGEALGSRQTQLKKGVINRCAELITALKVGKFVSKAYCQLARDNGSEEAETWTFTIHKHTYDLTSLKVPKYSEGNQAARMIGRLNYISESFEIIDELFNSYLEHRYIKNWKKTEEDMQNWIQNL